MIVLGVDPGRWTIGLAVLRLREDWTWELLNGMAVRSRQLTRDGVKVKAQTIVALDGSKETLIDDDRRPAWVLARAWLDQCEHRDLIEVCIAEEAVMRGGRISHDNTRCGAFVQGYMSASGAEAVTIRPDAWSFDLVGQKEGAKGQAAHEAQSLAAAMMQDGGEALLKVQHFCDAVAIAVCGTEAVTDIPS